MLTKMATAANIKNQNRVDNKVQGEESDFEFMMTVDLQQEQKDNSKPTKRKSYFEYCVTKHELNGIGKLLIEKGYSISNAFKDDFKMLLR